MKPPGVIQKARVFSYTLSMAKRSEVLCCLPQLPKRLRDYADKTLYAFLHWAWVTCYNYRSSDIEIPGTHIGTQRFLRVSEKKVHVMALLTRLAEFPFERSMKKTLRLVCVFVISAFLITRFLFSPCAVHASDDDPNGRMAREFTIIKGCIERLSREGAKIGCQVVLAKSGEVLWSHNPDVPLIPASNTKLLTTAVALIRLGTDYRFKTEVYATSRCIDGVINGDLYLKGLGDPFLVNEQMWALTHELAMMGIKRVTGDIIADESFFDYPICPGGWNPDRPPYWYNAEIGPLSFNFNTVTVFIQPGPAPGQKAYAVLDPDVPCMSLVNEALTVRAGRKRHLRVGREYSEGKNVISVRGHIALDVPPVRIYRAIKDPSLYTLMAFRSFLQQQKIECGGTLKYGKTPHNAIPLYTHESKPLSRIIADLNKISNNFIAEQILLTLGAEIEGPPGTYEKGLLVVKETLKTRGIDLTGMEIHDGSGLSPQNRIPARLICDILLYVAESEQCAPEFISSLAISGLDGTLKDRPLNGRVRGALRAKTGSIRGVSALSGYLWTHEGERIIFSLLMNGENSQTGKFIDSQDRIVHVLSNLATETTPNNDRHAKGR